MRTVPPLNNSLLKHPGANTPGLFTVFNILFISYSIAVKISPTAPTIPSSECIAVSWVSLAGVGNLLVQNFHNGYFLHVWDFSLVEKVEYWFSHHSHEAPEFPE